MSEPKWRRLLRFWRPDVEGDVDDEVAFHFQMRVEQFMQQGMSRADAERAARAQFGDVSFVRSELVDIGRRNSRRRDWRDRLDGAFTDVVVALRALRREPLFALGVVITLGLGVGANATMFGIIDRLMLSGPAHVVDAHRVNRLYITAVKGAAGVKTDAVVGYIHYAVLRDRATSFAAVGAYTLPNEVPFGNERDAPSVRVANVTWDLFPVLGVRPIVGRFFDSSEDRPPRGQNVAVISEALWRSEMGGLPSALGQSIRLGSTSYTVVGVAPSGFTGPERERTDVWLPMSLYAPVNDWPTSFRAQWLSIVGRLKPGISAEKAGVEATTLLRAAYNGPNANMRQLVASVRPLWYERFGRPSSIVNVSRWLMGVAAVVLLITCANVANLMLARGRRRRREVAVRLALGASGGRVFRFVLAETIVVALGGAIVALIVAFAGGRLMRATLLSRVAWEGHAVDSRVLLFTIVVALFVAIAVGVGPAWEAVRVGLTSALKAAERSVSGARTRLRTTLVVLQAALSVVLLIGAGLFVESLFRSRNVDLGFQARRVVRVQPRFPALSGRSQAEQDAERNRRRQVMTSTAERLSRVPELERTALAVATPFGFAFGVDLKVPGRDSIPELPGGGPRISAVSSDYFATVGTQLRRGRLFTRDDRDGSPLVTIVNETMAKTIWPAEEPLGKCLIIGDSNPPCSTVVGVVADVHQYSLREPPSMQYYVPFGQERGFGGTVILVRPRGNADEALALIRRAALETADFTGLRIETIQSAIDPEYRPWELGATMFAVFGVLALVIAAVGLYSVIAYLVADRTRELGVRIALGAPRGRIVRDVVARGAITTAIGVLIGSVVALLAGRYIEPLLFDVSAKNPVVISSVATVVVAIAIVAAWSPARRASRVDPVIALRAD